MRPHHPRLFPAQPASPRSRLPIRLQSTSQPLPSQPRRKVGVVGQGGASEGEGREMVPFPLPRSSGGSARGWAPPAAPGSARPTGRGGYRPYSAIRWQGTRRSEAPRGKPRGRASPAARGRTLLGRKAPPRPRPCPASPRPSPTGAAPSAGPASTLHRDPTHSSSGDPTAKAESGSGFGPQKLLVN